MKLIKTYLPVLFTVCLLLFNAHAALAEEIKDVEPGNALHTGGHGFKPCAGG